MKSLWEGLTKTASNYQMGNGSLVITFAVQLLQGPQMQELTSRLRLTHGLQALSLKCSVRSSNTDSGKVLETGSGLQGLHLSYVKDGETVWPKPQE